MKQHRNLAFTLIACGVALAMVSTAMAQSVGAKVVRIKGAARYSQGSAGWQKLNVGMVLPPGAVIQTSTDRGSYVDLVLGDSDAATARPVSFNSASTASPSVAYHPRSEQNTVRLMENTVLGIDRLSYVETGSDVVSDTQLDLKSGRIIGNVKKLSAASKYEVKLPNGVAGIRGTFYDISAEGVVRVVTGSVVVAYVGADGTVVTQVVSAGQQFDARTGQVSPIPASVMSELRLIEPVVPSGGTAGTSTSFRVGPEIYYVSPINAGDN